MTAAGVAPVRVLGLFVFGAIAISAGAASQQDILSDLSDPSIERKPMTAEELLASQPAELVDRLRREKVVMMQEVRKAGALSGGLMLALVIFEQPIDATYQYLSQTARQIEYRPEVTSIETVAWKEEGPVDVCRLRVLFRRYEYSLRYRLEPDARRIRWELDPDYDNDLRQVRGSWELYELDDHRTLARFGTSVDVGPAVPGFLQDWITRKNVPDSMDRARRWVDSGGRYRP